MKEHQDWIGRSIMAAAMIAAASKTRESTSRRVCAMQLRSRGEGRILKKLQNEYEEKCEYGVHRFA